MSKKFGIVYVNGERIEVMYCFKNSDTIFCITKDGETFETHYKSLIKTNIPSFTIIQKDKNKQINNNDIDFQYKYFKANPEDVKLFPWQHIVGSEITNFLEKYLIVNDTGLIERCLVRILLSKTSLQYVYNTYTPSFIERFKYALDCENRKLLSHNEHIDSYYREAIDDNPASAYAKMALDVNCNITGASSSIEAEIHKRALVDTKLFTEFQNIKDSILNGSNRNTTERKNKEMNQNKLNTLDILIGLADTRKQDDLSVYDVDLPPNIAEAIKRKMDARQAEQVDSAADIIVELLENAKKEIQIAVSIVREARRQERMSMQYIHKIELYRDFGAETNNWLMLYACINELPVSTDMLSQFNEWEIKKNKKVKSVAKVDAQKPAK